MQQGEFVRVLSLKADLPEGRMKSCIVAGRDIVVCNVKGNLYALDNVCTHAFARMTEGRLKGTRLMCPLHGAVFDVRDGRVLETPATEPLTTHAVRLVGTEVEVALNPAAAPQPV